MLGTPGYVIMEVRTEAEWLAGDAAEGRPADKEIEEGRWVGVKGANPDDPEDIWLKIGELHATEPRFKKFSELAYRNVGPKGDKGDQGDKGDKGDQGDQGPAGADSTVPGPVGPQRLSTNYIGAPVVDEIMETHLLVGGPTLIPSDFGNTHIVIRTADSQPPDLAFNIYSNDGLIGAYDINSGFITASGQEVTVPDNAILDFKIVRASANISQIMMVLEV